MGKPVAGDIVVVRFPFSDLRQSKRRPALVLATADFDNLILCQITSKPYSSKRVLELSTDDFATGGLSIVSYARPDKLFTADPEIIERTIGTLKLGIFRRVLIQVRRLFIEPRALAN